MSIAEKRLRPETFVRTAFIKTVKSPRIQTREAAGVEQWFRGQCHHCEELWDGVSTGT